MKLKEKSFPFWAVNVNKKDEYKIVRITGQVGHSKEYIYDTVIRVRHYSSIPPSAHSRKLVGDARYSKNTVSGFKDITWLPTSGKKILLDYIFSEGL